MSSRGLASKHADQQQNIACGGDKPVEKNKRDRQRPTSHMEAEEDGCSAERSQHEHAQGDSDQLRDLAAEHDIGQESET